MPGASSSAVKAGNAFVEVSAKSTGVQKELNKLKKEFQHVGEHVMKVGAGVAAGGALIFGALSELMHLATERGVEAARAAERLGTTTETISALGYAAQASGGDMETFEGAVRKMQNGLTKMEEDGGETANALSKIGLSAQELINLPLDDQLDKIADALEKVENASHKAAVIKEIFGKSGSGMLNMLKGGSAGLNELRGDALKNGSVVTGEMAENAEKSHKAFFRLFTAIKNVGYAIGEALLPMKEGTKDAIEKVMQITASIRHWIEENHELFHTIKMVALGVIAGGAALLGLGAIVYGVGAALGLLSTVIGAVIGVVGFLLSPLGLLVVGIAALGTGLAMAYGESESFAKVWADMGSIFGETFQGIQDALASGDLADAMSIAWIGIRTAFDRGVGELDKIWIHFEGFFVDVWEELRLGGALAWDFIADAAKGAVTLMVDGFNLVIDGINTMLSAAENAANRIPGVDVHIGRVGQIGKLARDDDPYGDDLRKSADRKRANDKEMADRLAKQSEIDPGLKAELDAKTAEAAQKRAAKEANDAFNRGIDEELAYQKSINAMNGVAGGIMAAGQIKGAFASTADARSFAYGDSTQKIVDYTKETAENTGKVADQLRDAKPGTFK